MNLYEQCKNFYVQEGEAEDPSHASVGLATSLEDLLFAESVGMCELAFEEQFHFGKEKDFTGWRWSIPISVLS